MSNFLTSASDILAVKDVRIEPLEIPEWGRSVYIRSLEGADRDAWEGMNSASANKGKVNLANVRARLAVLVVCDEHGVLLFKPQDATALGKKNSKALDRIFDKASQLSSLRDKDVEDAAKNSSSAPNDASGSA